MQFQCFPINSRRKTTFIRCLLQKFPVIDYQTLDRIRTTFIFSVTWFQFPSINRGRIASFTPMVFPTWPLFQQRLLNRTVDVCGSSMPLTARPWLDTGFFHPFLKMIPVFIDYCWISTVEIAFMLPPRGYPRSFNRYYINRHHTMYSYACKMFDPAGAFPFANAPAGPYRWNISALAFLCIRSHERQIIYMRLEYTFIFTCRKAICQRYSIFFFLSEAS